MSVRTMAFIATLLLSGCSTLRAPSSTESAWLALHAIDTAQTITIAQSPRCLHEKDPFAVAVYGSRKPSVGRVVVTNVVMGAIHWQAANYLERSDAHGLRWLFHTLSFLSSGYGVGNNAVRGVRPIAGDSCSPVVSSPYPLPRSGQ